MSSVGNMKEVLGCLEHFHFGEGSVTVAVASAYGLPALILTHAVKPGVPGQDAHSDNPSPQDPEVRKRSVVLTFENIDVREAIFDVLMGGEK